ncbi:MAG TPA: hypothetical protein VHL57_09475 [Flavobacteriales bacterium]|nr:hypothetical protein [Flavobacteriales bacterium]
MAHRYKRQCEQAGAHHVACDLTGLALAIYFLRLQTCSGIFTIRFVKRLWRTKR